MLAARAEVEGVLQPGGVEKVRPAGGWCGVLV